MELARVGMIAEHPDPIFAAQALEGLCLEVDRREQAFGIDARLQRAGKAIVDQSRHRGRRETAQLRRLHAFENCIVPAIDSFVPE